MRKRTVFKLCPTHKHYGGGRRTAQMFCEGGPGNGQPCAGNHCRILPGSDFFATDTTDATAATWAPNWSVNTPAAITQDAEMDTLGYICKKCEAPSPIGVGYAAYSPTAMRDSANITSCECGYSQKP